MFVELVTATTADGLRLDGALSRPDAEVRPAFDVDALLFLHGVGGTFYGGRMYTALLPAFLQQGVAVLRVNTRGHGSVSMIPAGSGAQRHGAAFEIVGQCRHDVAAWVDLLVERGCERVGVVGHSLGAIKAVYAEAHQPHPNVVCVVAASPPRLSYQAFRNSQRSSEFLESLATAQQYVEQGRPETLFTAQFPFPLLISAGSYVDKYGPGEHYNILEFVGQLNRPALFTFGQLELEQGGIAFAGLPEAIRDRAAESARIGVSTIAGADHFYTGVYDLLAAEMLSWLSDALPAA